MENLLNYIRTLTDFSDEAWESLQPALHLRKFCKNEFLLRAGEKCNNLFYVEKGYCKSYFIIDDEKKNTGFFFENEIATDIQSFGSGNPSAFNMVACEPMTVVIFDRKTLFEISSQHIEIERLGRNCIRQFALRQEEFANMIQLYRPLERLDFLERRYPEMVQRVPLTQLASFLGVARETLSRIRKRRTSCNYVTIVTG